MGSPLKTLPGAIAGCCLLAAAGAAQAATNAACVLAGKVLQVQAQPMYEMMVRVQVQGVKDDNTLRNDVECGKQFRVGDGVWVSQNTRVAKGSAKRPPIKVGDRIWLSFRYGEDRSGGSWRKYEAITAQDYMERKNGIQ